MLVAGSWWLFEWELANGASLAEARTAALNLFVVVEAFYLFSCRSLTRSAWRIGLFSNRWIILGVTVQAIGQLAITYLPAMNTVFGTAPIGAGRVAADPGHRHGGQPRGRRGQASTASWVTITIRPQ